MLLSDLVQLRRLPHFSGFSFSHYDFLVVTDRLPPVGWYQSVSMGSTWLLKSWLRWFLSMLRHYINNLLHWWSCFDFSIFHVPLCDLNILDLIVNLLIPFTHHRSHYFRRGGFQHLPRLLNLFIRWKQQKWVVLILTLFDRVYVDFVEKIIIDQRVIFLFEWIKWV